MNCPKCTGELQLKTYGEEISLHRCDVCHGLWCKPDSLMKMKDEWMSEAVLDIGNPAVGSRLNSIDNIACPEGHGPLEKRSDVDQTHIWYEECTTCQGVFLDAGEFTDLKFKTLFDWVRGLLAAKRATT